uniref:Uncharacterized protein n=1 Tax=Chromera velia CCMP2878 TaxID=1169474 RepID=A0A0G4HZY1_9ALVE|eukprot:Cvel_9840.t1-p1 / transcript=Cvel_9840.t1 / gene=Cvel_9840 / organism=Chromera_velia_CCMP2878 / gene_product=Putative ankyrin repeat protein RF_0381, putative / transcript_product=Putative ankyrin repeat protein RF_0381, putative / location=Cvel_scaffold579:58073-59476(+) / protein_length=468 / sequence_SO=supercontig / SO=protein_coding / is_pseudo=false
MVTRFRMKRELLAKIRQKQRERQTPSPSPSPSPSVSSRSSQLLPSSKEAEALSRLRRLATDWIDRLATLYCADLNEILSLNYPMDLAPLLVSNIGGVIRSFQVFSAQTLCDALHSFLNTGVDGNFSLYLKVGAEVNGLVNGETPLVKAVKRGSEKAVKMLLEGGAGLEVKGCNGNTALHKAVVARNPDMVSLLVSHKANVGSLNRGGSRPLHIASYLGFSDLVTLLLSLGADIHARDARRNTALHVAVNNGRRDTAELLLNREAKVEERGHEGLTALHLSAWPSCKLNDQREELAQMLVCRGADVNAKSTLGYSPLHFAALWGNPKLAKLLLANGADVHLRDRNGGSALHAAACSRGYFTYTQENLSHGRNRPNTQKKLQTAGILVSEGIDVEATDDSGRIALQCAERERNTSVQTFLAGLVQQEAAPDADHEPEGEGGSGLGSGDEFFDAHEHLQGFLEGFLQDGLD